MATRQIELPRQLRAAAIEPQSFNATDNTIEVIWTTGAAVRRMSWSEGPYDEELVVSPKAVRLGRLNAGAPFLNTHADFDLSDVIGAVVPGSARIANSVGVATIKLSTARGDADVIDKIKSGVIRNISVGYAIHGIEKRAAASENEVPVWRVVDWEPMEISAVPVPADAGAQIRMARSRGDLFSAEIIEAYAEPSHVRRARVRMSFREYLCQIASDPSASGEARAGARDLLDAL